ncbi:hypothetical protein B0T16DRAFT_450881 [Cercophora newfieldiana]|uniref:Uncharacterized protein n=1 Tax=Cercophora newfieldiana TaxID=92897 RepID=A0AA40CXG4_9PEZI|nr:hypothetical protein B0T16DRAFT_450881 [Cercophora newfieldiana]
MPEVFVEATIIVEYLFSAYQVSTLQFLLRSCIQEDPSSKIAERTMDIVDFHRLILPLTKVQVAPDVNFAELIEDRVRAARIVLQEFRGEKSGRS